MTKSLSQQTAVLLIRDGHRYKVTEIEKLAGPTASIKMVDTADMKPFSMVQIMNEQFWADLDDFRKNRENMPGMAFVIEMSKNPDGSGAVSWEIMALHDPTDRRYM
jgi:hypothetical protein